MNETKAESQRANLRTPRLELMPATLELVAADLHERERLPLLLGAGIGAGWPPPLFNVGAMQRLKQFLANPSAGEGWTAWYWIVRSPRLLVGLSGFKSEPVAGAVEILYSLLPRFQRRGLATEAIAAMTAWAFTKGAECVFAETLPELIASQRALTKNGFTPRSEGSPPGVLRFERRRTDWNISRSASR